MRKQFLLTVLTLLGCCTAAWADVEINEANFPDKIFRNWVLSQSYGQDGVLTDAEIAWITSIDVYGKYIQSLKGIEYFTALTQLHCESNRLTELDVSKNTALKYLYCYSNQLTALDVSGCTALIKLWCYDNQLTALDVSNNTALERLGCSSNQLTALDVSQNTTLEWLFCSNNQLTVLDVSKNTALTSLACCQNQIKGTGMDALVKSLPTINKGEMNVISNKNEQNVMNTAQVVAAKAKGWTPYYYDDSDYKWKEYEGSSQ